MTKPDTKTDALLDDLLKACESPQDILGELGLLKGLTKRLVEHALAAELTNHLEPVEKSHQRRSRQFSVLTY